jgi:outer membrane receptor protein involved in Fe transport
MRQHPWVVWAAAWVLVSAAFGAAGAEDGGVEPPERAEAEEEIVVIGRLPQLPLPPSSVPAAVHVIEGDASQRTGSSGVPESLAARVPGLSLSDEQGNSYQPDISLRGFQVTSVTGIPQGVSVFLDGVRVNEPTAEEINFDLLPTEDLDRIEVLPGPSVLFGRNTLAGAINLFTKRGKDGGIAFAEVAGGSAAFRKFRAGVSGRRGPVDFYLSGSDTREDGWRDASQARLSKGFGKLGFRANGTDLTLSYQHVDNRISQAGSLPVSELVRDRTANYTRGDFFAPRLDQLALNVRRDLGDRFSFSGNGFGRLLHVEQFNVNLLERNSRLLSRTASAGVTLQVDRAAPLFGRLNVLTVGLEYAHSAVDVSVYNPDQIDTKVRDRQNALGVYLQETIPILRDSLREEDELVLTAALRWDWIRHVIRDQSPPRAGREDASGAPAFRRVDPLIGLNYNLTREHGIYLSWSQGFRAPALLELTCAGPAAICPGLQAGTAPDPPLNPVRATNYEIGLRTRPLQRLSAQVSAYRTEVSDDIFSISPTGSTGVYFQNIGRTRRQGIEIGVRGKPASWLEAGLSYALTDARFLDEVVLATPRRTSGCDGASCTERVRSGSEFPLVPRHRGHAELELQLSDWLALSLGGTWVGAQFLRGDEENAAAQLDGYFTLDGGIRMSHAGFVAWTRFVNLLGTRYSSFGTFAANAKLPGAPVEPFLTPGRPFQVFAGMSYVLGSDGARAAR